MSKKITKSIGIFCKLRHFVNTQTLVQLYYVFVYSFLTYGCMVWGSTYCSNIKQLEIRSLSLPHLCFFFVQKRTIHIISFAKFDAYSCPLFAKLKIIKLHDIIFLYTACFMYQYSNCNLPTAFDSFFTAINTRHNYSTRLASKSTFCFPEIRTNYANFNIRHFGPKIWNEIEEQLKLSVVIALNGNSKNVFLINTLLMIIEVALNFYLPYLFVFFTWLFFRFLFIYNTRVFSLFLTI